MRTCGDKSSFRISLPSRHDAPLNRGGRRRAKNGGDGGESNSPSRNLLRRPLRACPMICRRSPGRPSAAYQTLQSRPLAGFNSGYATLLGIAPPLNDASTAHGGEAASTLTLLPKQRGRELTGCCQLLRLGSFLRGLEANLGSRSPITGPCRNHASPQKALRPARGLYRGRRNGQFARRPASSDAPALPLPTLPLPPLSGLGCGRGRRRQWRGPVRGASPGRRCRGGGRGAACRDPARSPAWLGRAG